MTASASPRRDFEIRWVAWLALCVSVFSFLFYFRRGDVLLYGDAVAHINIARRVFDSRTPGLLQLGTVWLPLPHLLMIPFLISPQMWQRGVGGSIPSMLAYVFGVVAIFRLIRGVLHQEGKPVRPAQTAAWIAALAYGANPNLIYMQTTAMGEAIYLAFFLWTIVFFAEFVRGDTNTLSKCGLCLAAASLTRYDGWFLAVILACIVPAVSIRFSRKCKSSAEEIQCRRRAILEFVLLAAAAPAIWLAYNAAVYRNPLEFANGPYSAKAIEKTTGTINPASGNLRAAALYFLKSAELNVAEPVWLGRLGLALAITAVVAVLLLIPRAWPLLILGIPFPFYALSIAYGGVPIFVPSWWPFSQYNVRYGLELLPALAAALAICVFLIMTPDKWPALARRLLVLVVIVFLGSSYASIWSTEPICYREAAVNMRGRVTLESQLANWLEALPPGSTLLMYLGEHPGAVEVAGIPLERVINEGNHRVWKQPVDPDGLWERTLANPAQYADYALAFEGDSVWQAVHRQNFNELVEINVTGQHRAILYRLRYPRG
jgi:hypothetical protein